MLTTAVDEFEKHGAEVSVYTETLDATQLHKIKDENDVIVYFIHLAPHSPYGSGGFNEAQAHMFSYVTKIDKEKSIAVATESPWVWFDWLPGAERFVNLYGWDAEVLRAMVRGFYGECEFLGKCPMPLDPLRGR